MPEGPRGEKCPTDVIGNAVTVAKIATGAIDDTRDKQPAKRNSGVAGMKMRAEKLTPEKRKAIAKVAAARRWE